MVLLADAAAAQHGSKGRLFPVLFKAAMSFFNACVRAKHLAPAKEFMFRFVNRVCTVPELAVEARLEVDKTTLRTIKVIETKYRLFSSILVTPRPRLDGVDGIPPLLVAIDVCRPDLVAAMLQWGSHVVESGDVAAGTQPMLHRVCVMEPPAVTFSCILTEMEEQEHSWFANFRMGGLRWKTDVSRPTWHESEISKKLGSVWLNLWLEDGAELGERTEVRVSVQLGVVGSSKSLSGEATITQGLPSTGFLLPISREDMPFRIRVEFAVSREVVRNAGRRRVRSRDEWRQDQIRVARLLIEHGADKDRRNRDGRLAWSLALEKKAPPEVTQPPARAPCDAMSGTDQACGWCS